MDQLENFYFIIIQISVDSDSVIFETHVTIFSVLVCIFFSGISGTNHTNKKQHEYASQPVYIVHPSVHHIICGWNIHPLERQFLQS